MSIEILHKDDLVLGGFAGLKEHRLVVDDRIGKSDPNAWNGLGNFVYLADANFLPHGETKMHSHKEIDVISVMVDGRIAHEGSLQHGKEMVANQVQVQRAGGEGFKHNEVNPDATRNRMIQLWVLPEKKGEPAGYKFYNLDEGKVKRIYGGAIGQSDTFASKTIIEVASLNSGQEISKEGDFIAYVTKGSANVDDKFVKDGDLFRGKDLHLKVLSDSQIIIVTNRSL